MSNRLDPLAHGTLFIDRAHKTRGSRIGWVLLLALASCGRSPGDDAASGPAASVSKSHAQRDSRRDWSVRLVDITEASGLGDFRHENGSSGKKYLPETMGAGAGFADFDLDGDLDLVVVAGRRFDESSDDGPGLRLFENLGEARFEEVLGAAPKSSFFGMGCAIADYDGDGDPDIFATALDGQRLFENRGRANFRFDDVTTAANLQAATWVDEKGTSHPSWSTAAAWFDADDDGDLDLFVGNYVRWSVENDIFASLVPGRKAFTTPDLYQGELGRFYQNRGDGTFEDVSRDAGVDLVAKTLGVALADVDGDHQIDLVVTNDTHPNMLYVNRGGGRFRDVGVEAGIAYDGDGKARAGMGVDVARLDPTRPTVAIGNFSEEPLSLYTNVRPPGPGQIVLEDRSVQSGLAAPTFGPLTFGVLLLDLDLDGHQDLILANGHIEPEIGDVRKDLAYAQRPQVFRNLGDGTFEDVSEFCGPDFQRPLVARGLATGDVDGDGDLDLLVTQNGREIALYRNDLVPEDSLTSLRIQLEQPGMNRNAIGAMVSVVVDGKRRSMRVRSGGSYLSESERTLTFGLGGGRVDRIEIQWSGPEGEIQILDEPELTDGILKIVRNR